MITTTLNEIRSHKPCQGGWEKLLKSLGKTTADDAPLTFRAIYDSNGPEDLLWCSCVLDKRQRVHLGALIAQTVLHLTDDKRVHDCVQTCLRYAAGEATEGELAAAAYAAETAEAAARGPVDVWAADAAARAAAADAAYAAGSAAYAANAAAWSGAAAKWEECAQIMLNFVEKAND